MKRHGNATGQRPGVWIALMTLLLVLLPAGCADYPSSDNEAAKSNETETASATVTIRWNDAPQRAEAPPMLAAALDCQASGVAEVFCEIYDDAGENLVTGGPFECAAGSGTVTGIPVGEERTFVVLAEDTDGNVVYQGETSGVTIAAGEITQDVVVDTFQFVPVLTAPEDQALIDPGAVNLQWEKLDNASQYRVVVASDEAFAQVVKEDVIDSLDADPMTYAPADIEASSTYYWRVYSIDIHGNQSASSQIRSFSTSDCTFEISQASQEFNPEGGSGTFDVSASSSNCQWSATTDADWIQITSGTEGSGNGTVNYTVTANSGADRTATVIAAGQTHTVSQTSGTCTYTIAPTEHAVAAGGESYQVSVTAPHAECEWTTTVPENANWITLSPASATGSGSVTVTVAANTGVSRQATITIAGRTHTISQAAGACNYTLDPTGHDVSAQGESYPVSVTATHAECEWTASVPTNVNWITLSPASGTGNGSVTVTVARNRGRFRQATITIANQPHTVSQAAGACNFTIDPVAGTPVAALGGSYTVAISASHGGCDWTTAVPEASSSWITISPASGSGSGIVTIIVAANSGVSRQATITIAGKTHTVSQAAGACTYSINPVASSTISANGGSYPVSVTATHAECAWTTAVPEANSSWIALSPASGTGSGTVTVTLQSNPSFLSRSANVTIAGQTHMVIQAGGIIPFSVRAGQLPLRGEDRQRHVASLTLDNPDTGDGGFSVPDPGKAYQRASILVDARCLWGAVAQPKRLLTTGS